MDDGDDTQSLLKKQENEPIQTSRPIIYKTKEIDQAFLTLVESGSSADVKDFLKENPDFDINYENFRGANALNIAVRNEDEEMVKALLTYDAIDVKDSHLFAIRESNVEILVLLLDRLRSINPDLEVGPYQGQSSEFSSDMTPLMLACHLGDFEIIQLLLERGHQIYELQPHCSCNRHCRHTLLTEDIAYCKRRLNTVKALANPAYICLTSKDPILTAFQLQHQIKSSLQRRLYPEYEELIDSLNSFIIQLLDLCHTSEEVEIMMNVNTGFVGTLANLKYSRVKLAIVYRHKKFVTHPSVQQVLRRIWFGNCHAMNKHSRLRLILYSAGFALVFPIAVICYFVTPRSTFGKLWASPIARFIGYFSSYILFLILNYIYTNSTNIEQGRGPPSSGMAYAIVIWVLGFILRDITKFFIRGPKLFISTKWILVDMLAEMFFVLAFVSWIVSYVDITNNNNEFLERKSWNSLDPILISEAFLAIGGIFSMTRMFCLVQLSPKLGPLLISLEKMAYEIVRQAIPFLIIIISFASALHYLFWYYGEIDENSDQLESFRTFRLATKSLFWSLFGAVPLEAIDIVSNNSTGPNQHWVTQEVVYFLFGAYHVIAILLFMNMVIARMTSRMDRVLANADLEWKFSQTLLWLDFFDDVNVLPVPFNLLGMPWVLGKLCRQCFSRSSLGTVKCNCQTLLSKLIRRYFNNMSHEE